MTHSGMARRLRNRVGLEFECAIAMQRYTANRKTSGPQHADQWRVGKVEGLIAIQVGTENEPVFLLSRAEANRLGNALVEEAKPEASSLARGLEPRQGHTSKTRRTPLPVETTAREGASSHDEPVLEVGAMD
jgi:hypothetical protein